MAFCQRHNQNQWQRANGDLEREKNGRRKKSHKKLLKFVIPNFKLKCVKSVATLRSILSALAYALRSITLYPR